jgi:hypothetical protein
MRVSLSNSRRSRTGGKPRRRISKSQGDSARWALTAARWRISVGRGRADLSTPRTGSRSANFREHRSSSCVHGKSHQSRLLPSGRQNKNSRSVNQPTKPFAGRSAGYAQAAARRGNRRSSIVTATRPLAVSFPALSCRSCRPHAPFAELVRLSRTSIADEMRIEHRWRVLGE